MMKVNAVVGTYFGNPLVRFFGAGLRGGVAMWSASCGSYGTRV